MKPITRKIISLRLWDAYKKAHESKTVYGIYDESEDTKIRISHTHNENEKVIFTVKKWSSDGYFDKSRVQDLENQIKNVSLMLSDKHLPRVWANYKGRVYKNKDFVYYQDETLF